MAKFDNKDIITKNKDEKISNTITQETQDSPSLISCNHCSYQGNSEYEVLRHSVNAHPGKPARPDPSLLELIIKEKNKKDEEEKRIKEEIRRWEEER